jgi:SAM-dependent methyltransferase
LHQRRLVEDLVRAFAEVEGPVRDALDVFCGSRPYDDLFPRSARRVGLDVEGNPYGVADVVTNEFLPFPSESFDLVTCIEGFHYVEDPIRGVAELGRVLRPGGTAIVTVPFAWEYDRSTLERRWTGPGLAALFGSWDDVRVVENGGRAVVWATVTGSILKKAGERLARVHPVTYAARGVAMPIAYRGVNYIAMALDSLERKYARGPFTLPMNLLLTARRPRA